MRPIPLLEEAKEARLGLRKGTADLECACAPGPVTCVPETCEREQGGGR